MSEITGRDIDENDVDLSSMEKDMFVAFYTGFIEEEGYGEKNIFPSIRNYLMNL